MDATSWARFSVDEDVRRGSSPTSRFATEARRCSSLVGILDLRSSRRRPSLGTAPAKRRTPKTSVKSRRAKGASRRLPGRKVVFDGRRRLRCRISRSSRLNRDTWGLSCALASWRTLGEPDVQECRSRTCCPPVWSGRRRGVSAVCVTLGSQTQLKGFRLLSKRSRRVCTCANVRVRCACSYGEYLFAICRPNLGSALFLRSTLSPSGKRRVYNSFFFLFPNIFGFGLLPSLFIDLPRGWSHLRSAPFFGEKVQPIRSSTEAAVFVFSLFHARDFCACSSCYLFECLLKQIRVLCTLRVKGLIEMSVTHCRIGVAYRLGPWPENDQRLELLASCNESFFAALVFL